MLCIFAWWWVKNHIRIHLPATDFYAQFLFARKFFFFCSLQIFICIFVSFRLKYLRLVFLWIFLWLQTVVFSWNVLAYAQNYPKWKMWKISLFFLCVAAVLCCFCQRSSLNEAKTNILKYIIQFMIHFVAERTAWKMLRFVCFFFLSVNFYSPNSFPPSRTKPYVKNLWMHAAVIRNWKKANHFSRAS